MRLPEAFKSGNPLTPVLFSLRRPFTLPLVLRTGNKAQFELEEEEEEDTRPMEVTYHKTHTKTITRVGSFLPMFLFCFYERAFFFFSLNKEPEPQPRTQGPVLPGPRPAEGTRRGQTGRLPPEERVKHCSTSYPPPYLCGIALSPSLARWTASERR